MDVAVESGRIARADESIHAPDTRRVLDVSVKIVCSGSFDLHAHVFDGVTATGAHPDLAGVRAGVTTVVDVGSSGSATFAAFPRHILPNCQTEVLPFLHICRSCQLGRVSWRGARLSYSGTSAPPLFSHIVAAGLR